MGYNDVELVAGGYPKFTYHALVDGCKVLVIYEAFKDAIHADVIWIIG